MEDGVSNSALSGRGSRDLGNRVSRGQQCPPPLVEGWLLANPGRQAARTRSMNEHTMEMRMKNPTVICVAALMALLMLAERSEAQNRLSFEGVWEEVSSVNPNRA